MIRQSSGVCEIEVSVCLETDVFNEDETENQWRFGGKSALN